MDVWKRSRLSDSWAALRDAASDKPESLYNPVIGKVFGFEGSSTNRMSMMKP